MLISIPFRVHLIWCNASGDSLKMVEAPHTVLMVMVSSRQGLSGLDLEQSPPQLSAASPSASAHLKSVSPVPTWLRDLTEFTGDADSLRLAEACESGPL